MRTHSLILFIALLTTGCAGATIKDKMGAYLGQPASTLFDKLGYPTDQQMIAGKKAYLWTTMRFVEGSSYQCKIRVIVDDKDVITNWDFEGNEGGCGRYAMKLFG